MTALRQFLSRREVEIAQQLQLLEAELTEIRAARSALKGLPEVSREVSGAPALTIKDMIRTTLSGKSEGMAAIEILQEIESRFGVWIERTSLSPQLSRLRNSNEVTLENGRWYASQIDLSDWIKPANSPLSELHVGFGENARSDSVDE